MVDTEGCLPEREKGKGEENNITQNYDEQKKPC
jgi:hypothetical protein